MDRLKRNLGLKPSRKVKGTKTLRGKGKTANPESQDVSMEQEEKRPSTAVSVTSMNVPMILQSDEISALPAIPEIKSIESTQNISFNSTEPLPQPSQEEKETTHHGILHGLCPRSAAAKLDTAKPRNYSMETSVLNLTMDEPSPTEEPTFDLKAPPPQIRPTSMEFWVEKLLSQDHLETILQDSRLLSQFSAFINSYRPDAIPILRVYLDTAKAIKAIEYANSVASMLGANDRGQTQDFPKKAATINPEFEAENKRSFEILIDELLPAFITSQIIETATQCMMQEVSGAQGTTMRDLISGLTETFCISDPNLPDNPIIFASEGFYRMTGYQSDMVIGRNCRFLQGPHLKKPQAALRTRQALEQGHETTDIILNYRRDGTPFLNCYSVAPLLDDKGNIKYYIGSQVDVSGIVEKGKGMHSFQKLLSNMRLENSDSNVRTFLNEMHTGPVSSISQEQVQGNYHALTRLRELSELLDIEESTTVQIHSQKHSLIKEWEDYMSTYHMGWNRSPNQLLFNNSTRPVEPLKLMAPVPSQNTFLGLEAPLSTVSPGKLPTVYQNYFIVRPDSYLRIVFVSPGLHHVGKELLQSSLLSHISAADGTLAGLKEAFAAGVPITAKVTWSKDDGLDAQGFSKGQSKWLCATPLLGSDQRVGVWMIILLDRQSEEKLAVKANISAPRGQQKGEDRYSKSSMISSSSRVEPKPADPREVPLSKYHIEKTSQPARLIPRQRSLLGGRKTHVAHHSPKTSRDDTIRTDASHDSAMDNIITNLFSDQSFLLSKQVSASSLQSSEEESDWDCRLTISSDVFDMTKDAKLHDQINQVIICLRE